MRKDGNKEINNHVSKKMSEHLLDSKSNDKNKLQDKELGTDGGGAILGLSERPCLRE